MARLPQLVAAVAEALHLPQETVALAARYIREAGLIAQTGRGITAANMGPSDCSHLVIGLLAANAVKQSATSAELSSHASFWQYFFQEPGQPEERITGELPPFPFLRKNGRMLDFGAALAALFAEVIKFGAPQAESDLAIIRLKVELDRPGLYPRFYIDEDGDGPRHTIVYHRTDPRLEGLQGAALLRAARRAQSAGLGIDHKVSIELDVIHFIADAIREPAKKPVRLRKSRTPKRG